MKPLTTVLKRAFGALIALLVLFEEWGWEPLQRLMARIARLPGLRQLEAAIARLPPWAALVVVEFMPVALAECGELITAVEKGRLRWNTVRAGSSNYCRRSIDSIWLG